MPRISKKDLVMNQTFGSVIRDKRLALNMSQQQLADILGVTQPSINRWEADQSFPKPPQLAPLSNALEIPLDELLALLEEYSRRPGKSTRDQIVDINTRLDRLEHTLEQILKSVKKRD